MFLVFGGLFKTNQQPGLFQSFSKI